MIINASENNFSKEDIVDIITKKYIAKKPSLLLLKRKKVWVKVDSIELFYFPFWIALMESAIHHKLVHPTFFRLLFALEEYTGKVGITVGIPRYKKQEVEGSSMIQIRHTEEEAKEKLLLYASDYIAREKKVMPDISILEMRRIWRPIYLVSLRYCDGNSKTEIRRFIDGESGVIVYRYDLYYKDIMASIF